MTPNFFSSFQGRQVCGKRTFSKEREDFLGDFFLTENYSK